MLLERCIGAIYSSELIHNQTHHFVSYSQPKDQIHHFVSCSQPYGQIRGQFQPLKIGKGADSVLSYCTPIMKAINATTGGMACATCGTGPGGAGENLCGVSIDGKPVPLESAAGVAQQFMAAIAAGFL
jgi:hypothetical protein